jgi:hypothetical protein
MTNNQPQQEDAIGRVRALNFDGGFSGFAHRDWLTG